MRFRKVWGAAVVALLLVSFATSPAFAAPTVVAVAATPTFHFPPPADSNSPAEWQSGQLNVFTSDGSGHVLKAGFSFTNMDWGTGTVVYTHDPSRWVESTYNNLADGYLYGFYHEELRVCGNPPTLSLPRIGAIRSGDNGATWKGYLANPFIYGPEDPLWPGTPDCNSWTFAGGVGDFTAISDGSSYMYFYYSSYATNVPNQGIAAARLPLANLGNPAGNVKVWSTVNGIADWRDATAYAPTPIFIPSGGAGDFHYGPSVKNWWGPSVHWNTYLNKYVMLLNYAHNAIGSCNTRFWPDGVWFSYNNSLDPTGWSFPTKFFTTQAQTGCNDLSNWIYPQVIGDTDMVSFFGTDKLARNNPRFYLGGKSSYTLVFTL